MSARAVLGVLVASLQPALGQQTSTQQTGIQQTDGAQQATEQPVGGQAGGNRVEDIQFGESADAVRIAFICRMPCAIETLPDGVFLRAAHGDFDISLAGRSRHVAALLLKPVDGGSLLTVEQRAALTVTSVGPCTIHGNAAACIDYAVGDPLAERQVDRSGHRRDAALREGSATNRSPGLNKADPTSDLSDDLAGRLNALDRAIADLQAGPVSQGGQISEAAGKPETAIAGGQGSSPSRSDAKASQPLRDPVVRGAGRVPVKQVIARPDIMPAQSPALRDAGALGNDDALPILGRVSPVPVGGVLDGATSDLLPERFEPPAAPSADGARPRDGAFAPDTPGQSAIVGLREGDPDQAEAGANGTGAGETREAEPGKADPATAPGSDGGGNSGVTPLRDGTAPDGDQATLSQEEAPDRSAAASARSGALSGALSIAERAEEIVSASFDLQMEAETILGLRLDRQQCDDARSRLQDDAWALDALVELGFCKALAGRLDAADDDFARLLAYAPRHMEALVGRALVAAERGDIDRAHQFLSASLEAAPPWSAETLLAMRDRL